MGTSITGIPTTRVSSTFIRQKLLNQVMSDQQALYKLQLQLATGHRYEVPSEDPVSSLRAMSLQRLLEQKTQINSNLSTTQSYLSNTDTTLGDVSSNMADVRAAALGVAGTLASDEQRLAAAQQVRQALESLVDTGNQNFRGRYIFAGSLTSVRPFVNLDDGTVRYDGNELEIQSYADLSLLTSSNLDGNAVFGAISDPVCGSVDLEPVLTLDTRVSDLRGGKGISKGSIAISNGSNVSTIDLSSAETIGDIAALIKTNPPTGSELYVEVTSTTIQIQMAGSTGNLSISEVGGGTVANELGILRPNGVGTAPIIGRDLDPVVRSTTSLDDVLGVHAWAVLHSPGVDNDIRIIADAPGEQTAEGVDLNDLDISIVDDPAVTAGNELVVYDPVAGTLVISVDEGYSTAKDVIDAINAEADIPYTASIDPLDDVEGGEGVVMTGITAVTAEGDGITFDKDSGLRIVNQNETFDVAFSTAETVEDLLNTLNGLGAGLTAEINDNKTGINVRSCVSGCDFMIGENGGETATQLGLRTFTGDTLLEDLNYGWGVHTADGVDFTITLAGSPIDIEGNPIPLEVDISGMTTIGEVIAHINTLAPGELEASLAEFGNGITLTDTSSGANTFRVERTEASKAAIDLGLIPVGEEESVDPTVTGIPEVTMVSAAAKSNLIFQANTAGSDYNNTEVIFDAAGVPGSVAYDPVAGTLTFGIAAGVTTALDIVNALALSPESAYFTAAFDPTDGSHNDGTGNVDATDPVTPPEASGGSMTTYATATVTSAGFDNDMIFTANNLGALYNGTQVNFVDNIGSGAAVVTSYTAGVEMTIQFDSTAAHTANDIMAAIAADPAVSADWTVTLDPTDESPNLGEGFVDANPGEPMVGGEQVLDGSDVHKLETQSIFTALIRLQHALETNDTLEVQRAIDILDTKLVDLNFARAELGAREQSIELLQQRAETEDVSLQTSLSLEYDADMVEVISDLMARQASYEGSLKSMGTIMNMSLLDYL